MINIKLVADWWDSEVKTATPNLRRPPARFIGGKYGAKGALAEALVACGSGFDIALDPFGGSGMVSRAIKDAGMANHVVYGDFDGYARRVRYMQSPAAMEHHGHVRGLLRGIGRDKRIPDDITKSIATYFHDAPGDVLDVWLPYLSFAGKDSAVRDIASIGRYNRVPAKWPNATGWLDGLQTIHGTDARDIIKAFAPFQQRTLVVLDPPYPGTHGASYRDASWSISDYEAMINDLLAQGVDTILVFGDDRSGVMAMMNDVPASKMKRIEFDIKTNGTAVGSLDAAYVIRGHRGAPVVQRQ